MENTKQTPLEQVTLAADRLSGLLAGMMADPHQFYRYILPRAETYDPPLIDEAGNQVKQRRWSEVQVLERPDMAAIKEAVMTLKCLVATLRDLYALPSQPQAHRQQMDQLRLELLENKVDKAEAMVISLEGGAEELAQ